MTKSDTRHPSESQGNGTGGGSKKFNYAKPQPIHRLPDEGRIRGIVCRVAEGDDRRLCTECGNLDDHGYCLAAERKEIIASSKYQPVRDILRRCEAFLPMTGDSDQTPGSEKWGWLKNYTGR